MFFQFVPGEVYGAMLTLFGFVDASDQVWTQGLALTGIATAIGTFNVYQVTALQMHLES